MMHKLNGDATNSEPVDDRVVQPKTKLTNKAGKFKTHSAADKPLISYRKCADLEQICASSWDKVSEVVGDYSFRLCYFNGLLHAPLPPENGIYICDLDLEHIKTVRLETIEFPRSLCPQNGEQLMLAAKNGLYLVNSDLSPLYRVKKGDYQDIYCDGDVYATIENLSPKDNVRVNSTRFPYTEQSQFYLKHSDALSVHVARGRVYVSDSATDQVTEYSTQGQQLATYGPGCVIGSTTPGELCTPYICMSDTNGRVMVADWGNDRLQVVSPETREWWVVPVVEVECPMDALLIGDKLYILSYNRINKYEKENSTKTVN